MSKKVPMRNTKHAKILSYEFIIFWKISLLVLVKVGG